MKKQNKKSQQKFWRRLFANKKNTAISLLSLAVLVAGGYYVFGYGWAYLYNQKLAHDFVASDGIRQLIIHATDGLGRDAPVEAKTGDIYFPEAKLYLPRPADAVQLGYSVYTYDDVMTVSIFDRAAVNRQQAKLLSASDVDKVFDEVPSLQACSRGTGLTYDANAVELKQPEMLVQTVALANGKTLYTFTEKNCPSHHSLSTLLKGLQSY